MALNEALLPEFDLEMANTRKTLERVPDEKLGWKPHEKSGTMGWLAGRVANMTISQDSLDVAPKGGPAPQASPPTTRKALLEAFVTRTPPTDASPSPRPPTSSSSARGRCLPAARRCSPCRASLCCGASS